MSGPADKEERERGDLAYPFGAPREQREGEIVGPRDL